MNPRRHLGRLALQIYREQDPAAKERAAYFQTTCTRGCDHCCYQLVIVNTAEAVAIAAYLLDKQRDMPVLKECRKSLLPLSDPGMTRFSYFEQQQPCVFLKDHQCSIYEVRPSACRWYYAVTPPALCGVKEPDVAIARVDLRPLERRLMAILSEACKEADLPFLVAPLQVLLPLVLTLLTEGKAAFLTAIKEARGVSRPSYWTSAEGGAFQAETLAQIMECARSPR